MAIQEPHTNTNFLDDRFDDCELWQYRLAKAFLVVSYVATIAS